MEKAAKVLPVATAIPEISPLSLPQLQSLAERIATSKTRTTGSDFICAELNIPTVERYGDEVKITETGITGIELVLVEGVLTSVIALRFKVLKLYMCGTQEALNINLLLKEEVGTIGRSASSITYYVIVDSHLLR